MSRTRRTLLLCLLLGIASNYGVGVVILVVPAWIDRMWPTFWPSPGPVLSSFSPDGTAQRLHILTSVDFARVDHSANYTGPLISPDDTDARAVHKSIVAFAPYLQEPEEADLLAALRGVRLSRDELLVSLGVTRFGWPCHALSSTSIASISDAGVTVRYPGTLTLPVRGSGMGPAMLPLVPLWSGFALNALFWGAVWTLPMFGIAALIARLRRKAEHCAACKYDLRGLATAYCPECGIAISGAVIANPAEPSR